MKVALFSRDDRTFKLFRETWCIAFSEKGFEIIIKNRGFGFYRAIRAVFGFIYLRNNLKVIFGTSEICLYSIFSNKRDIWVFTGLGRLLQGKGALSRIIICYLKISYKGQRIVGLNFQDVTFLDSIFFTKSILINGEGFNFSQGEVCQSIGVGRPIKIAYVGRLLKSKRVDVLVRQFVLISNLDCELHLIGDFDYSNLDSISPEWLAEKSIEAGGHIKCHGFIGNVRDILRNIDIFVSLSEREGLPFSVLEALEAGCFVVLSKVPGHLSFEGLEGVAFVEPHALAKVLMRLIDEGRQDLNFDTRKRIKICIDTFGRKKVISQINNILVEN